MSLTTWLSPVELVGQHVRLRPLLHTDKDNILAASNDGELWRLWFTSAPSAQTIDSYLAKALADQQQNLALPFVVEEKSSGKVIGMTRFCNAVALHRRLEIGYTWYAKSYQRTAVNTECKYLLLQYAFEQLNVIAVEFRTHWHNHQSRAAIARLGAKQDGVLRNHQIEADGAYRDTVVFSIINSEWPSVQKSLAFKLFR